MFQQDIDVHLNVFDMLYLHSVQYTFASVCLCVWIESEFENCATC